MAGKLVIVPNGEIRSTSQNEKGRKFATIHTGKFEIVAEVTNQGRVRVPREVVDEMFDIIEPEAAAEDARV